MSEREAVDERRREREGVTERERRSECERERESSHLTLICYARCIIGLCMLLTRIERLSL